MYCPPHFPAMEYDAADGRSGACAGMKTKTGSNCGLAQQPLRLRWHGARAENRWY